MWAFGQTTKICTNENFPLYSIWKSAHLAQALQIGLSSKPEYVVRLVYKVQIMLLHSGLH